MFISTVHVGGHHYARIVESQRVNGKPVHRVVANLGSVESLKKSLPTILRGLHKILGEDLPEDEIALESISHRERGVSLAVEALWSELGLGRELRRLFKAGNELCPAELLVRTMVTNRLSDPASKLGIVSWLGDVSMGEEEDGWLEKRLKSPVGLANRFYESMDGLLRHRAAVERFLFGRLTDLFHLKVDVVFYDLTSSYFEGFCSGYGRLGYSRDERSGNEQIMIGLILVDGLPIGHHVFRGNRSDKTCLKAAVEDIERRFRIERIILVGDRGLLSEENLATLREKGHEYILACRRRRDADSRRALRERPPVPQSPAPSEGEEPAWPEPVIWSTPASDGDRLVGHTNPAVASYDHQHREDILDAFREELRDLQERFVRSAMPRDRRIALVAELLASRHGLGKRYFTAEVDSQGRLEYRVKQWVLKHEALIDGTTVLKTNNTVLTDAEVVARYKELAKIERAFRDLKSLIDLRPIHHWKARRIAAHVFVCMLALLLDRLIARKLATAGIADLSAEVALAELQRLRVLRDHINGIEITRLSSVTPSLAQVLAALGVAVPNPSWASRSPRDASHRGKGGCDGLGAYTKSVTLDRQMAYGFRVMNSGPASRLRSDIGDRSSSRL